MNTPPEVDKEIQLKLLEMRQNEQQYSYDLVQKLTLFIISIELIFCGYILLNSQNLGQIRHSSILFLFSGLAAISGLLWRFCYNQTFHEKAHGENTKLFKVYHAFQISTYWFYVILTIFFFICTVSVGFNYIRKIEKNEIKTQNYNKDQIDTLYENIDGMTKSVNNISSSIQNLSNVIQQIYVDAKIPENDKKSK